jgi:four helix bundle protein
MQDFRDLKVWQKAHRFVLDVYTATHAFPREELYGLTSQLRRAAVSIPTNMAEGCGRGTDIDFARFLQISLGSACESEYLLLLSRDLKYLPQTLHDALADAVIEVKRMLAALMQTVRRDRLIADG